MFWGLGKERCTFFLWGYLCFHWLVDYTCPHGARWWPLYCAWLNSFSVSQAPDKEELVSHKNGDEEKSTKWRVDGNSSRRKASTAMYRILVKKSIYYVLKTILEETAGDFAWTRVPLFRNLREACETVLTLGDKALWATPLPHAIFFNLIARFPGYLSVHFQLPLFSVFFPPRPLILVPLFVKWAFYLSASKRLNEDYH